MGASDHGPRSIRSIAMLGNHLPRQCGIATFTADLADAIEQAHPDRSLFVLAMNDVGARHGYPERVRFEIPEGEIEAYGRAADFLNLAAVDVLSVQHEYGIFGGKAGAHVLEMLRHLRMPVVTTLHTILAAPDTHQRAVLEELVGLSERVVVMSSDGAELLKSVHGVDPGKIDIIPHGIPQVPDRRSKDRLGIEGGSVILTFGLLSPDKGIEYVIDAMPSVLAKHPHTTYIVLGATHPHVKKQQGEAYRLMLQARAQRLGVEANVVFQNRFVSESELVEFLGAADLYVTPYLKEEQSTSGTLAYAVGCGKAVVSTPYRYARELLGEGRGILVPWRDSEAIGRELVALLDDPEKRRGLEKRAATFGKSMAWPVVAGAYVQSFERARVTHEERGRVGRAVRLARRRPELPDVDLSHMRVMTDDTGILQHATFDIPCYQEGYCLDDNARALLLVTHIEEARAATHDVVRALATRYLAFVAHAFDASTGRFRNFLTYARTWHDGNGSDDSHGRALWALGTVVARTSDAGRRGLSARLFHGALAAAPAFTSPRGWAYALLGIDEYLKAFAGDRDVELVRRTLTDHLMERFAHSSSPDWPWFEDRLTYCNARLPQALFVSGHRMNDDAVLAVAQRSLSWLVKEHESHDGSFAPVGTNGFFVRGGPRATFDQQPVEACAMVSACLDAHRITGRPHWLDSAHHAFQWFLGRNPGEVQVYDAKTGGCRDGIHQDRLNENQGAESTLSFLAALVEMRAADRATTKPMPMVKRAVEARGETALSLAARIEARA